MRRPVLAALPLALLVLSGTAAVAGPKPKPFTTTYEASAPVPGVNSACAGGVPMARHLRDVPVPAAGRLKVDLTGFAGDWDLRLQQAGKDIAESQLLQPLDGQTESIVFPVKKAGTFTVVACNYYGGPTGSVRVAYTP